MLTLPFSRRLGDRWGDDRGVTFLELLVAMVLFGILAAVAVGPFAAYRAKQEHVGSARELVAFLRRAQVRAVAEETTYRVDIAGDGKSATMYRFNGTTYVAGLVSKPIGSRITYTNPSFVQSSGASGTSVYFYARGSASKGSVTVSRSGNSKTYSVNVEGLTARVSYQ